MHDTRSSAGHKLCGKRHRRQHARVSDSMVLAVLLFDYLAIPGEKDHANMRLVRALVGTTQISADICEILTVQRPVTPKRAGASGSRINDDGISTLKQACSRRYSGSLKLSSRRFERA